MRRSMTSKSRVTSASNTARDCTWICSRTCSETATDNSTPPISTPHAIQRHCPDFTRLARAAEGFVACLAYGLGRLHRILEVLAGVEFALVFIEIAADSPGHCQPDVGVDIDFAHPVLDAFLDLLDRH